ncbi:hypothetical protein D3C76_1376050 [compost metagenome]|uniref:hypothetical protein n=1 Tax=Pseudomonas sp. BP8 TaxID=2817864 RepID=UPI000FA6C075|nr:hypothetical protein [Pseudomonas sp. BP8]MBP2262322.1 hypothetical protein [Pseudomonas sp. BP8]HDS1733240.1 hypothetical protein [Pseudomonas putida]
MKCNNGAAAIQAWRNRFLRDGALAEDEYDSACRSAEELERSGIISDIEWVHLVKQANAELLTFND